MREAPTGDHAGGTPARASSRRPPAPSHRRTSAIPGRPFRPSSVSRRSITVGAVRRLRHALSTALPSCSRVTRPISSMTVRVPDVTAKPSTVVRSRGSMRSEEVTVPRVLRSFPWRADEEHQRALVEPVEPMQRGSSLGRNQRARPEIEEPGVEAPSPVEHRPRKGQRVLSDDDEPARVDAPTDGVEAQARATRPAGVRTTDAVARRGRRGCDRSRSR